MSTVDLTENRQAQLRATNIAIVALAVIFVGLRVAARCWMTRVGLGRDDYLMLLALVFLFGAEALALLGIHYGVGTHAAGLSTSQLVGMSKTLMAFECVYVTCICIVKLSLLSMYYRVFPVRQLKIGAFVLGFISIAWAISIIMVSVFECIPVAKAWDSNLKGFCINQKGSYIGNAIPNILTDIAILMMPMPQVWRLHTSFIQRAELSLVFLLGSFVVFTSIYRFTTLFQFTQQDPTWTLATAWTWCVVESASGIISACLPTLGPFAKYANRALGFSASSYASPPGSKLQTIGGSGNPSRNLDKGSVYDGSRSKTVGSRPFQRLDEASGTSLERPDERTPQFGTKIRSEVDVQDLRDGGEGASTDGDEVPLKGIRVRTDVQWSEEERTSVKKL